MMKAILVGRVGEKYCDNCKYFFKITEKAGVCILHGVVRLPNWHCPLHEYGESEATFEDVIDTYYKLNESLKHMQIVRESLRQLILSQVKDERKVGDFIINVKEVTQRRLDTKKVKEYLKEQGKFNEFMTEVKCKVLHVKKI